MHDEQVQEITFHFIDRHGRIWVSDSGELYELDPEELTLRRRASPGERSEWSSVYFYADADSNVIWLGRTRRIDKLDLDSGVVASYPLDELGLDFTMGRHDRMLKDRSGRIWLGTSQGMVVLDPTTGTVERYRHDPADPFSVPCNYIVTLVEDRVGNMWAGTLNCGLAKSYSNTDFRHFAHRTDRPGGLAHPHVSGLFELKDGTLLVTTRDGQVQRFDPHAGTFERFHLADGRDPPTAVVKDVQETSDGALWLATWGSGAVRVDRQSGTFRRYKATEDASTLVFDRMRILEQDPDGVLWLGTAIGLSRYDGEHDRFVSFTHDPQDPQSLSIGDVWSLHFDKEGRFWVGTYGGGINLFDPLTGTSNSYRHDPTDSTSLSNDNVSDIVETEDGALWLATYGGGLNRLDPETGRFRRLTTREGLPNNHLADLIKDDRGILWMSSDDGITRFDPADGSMRTYAAPAGLESFSVGAALKRADGTLLFGGINGFISFHPDSLMRPQQPPPVTITDFKIFDQSVPPHRRPASGDTLRLRYAENFISFEFAALDFTDPARNQYAYMLEGFDPDWVYSGNRRYAAYTNLDPGRYTLRVRAANSDGVWNRTGLAVPIEVVPPFWMTLWFRITAGLFVVGAAGGLAYYVSRQRHEREMEELRTRNRLQMERERISYELHDSVGAHLSGIVADVDLIRIAKKQGKDDLAPYLDVLGEDARKSLAQLRETVWALHHEAATLGELCRQIDQFGRRMTRRGEAPDIDCSIDEESEGITLTPEQTLHLFRIAQEAVHNAVKHSGACRISVRLMHTNGEITLTVGDDGSFRSSSDAAGLGLKSMRDRAEALSGTFAIHPGADGTQVRVRVPAA